MRRRQGGETAASRAEGERRRGSNDGVAKRVGERRRGLKGESRELGYSIYREREEEEEPIGKGTTTLVLD